MNRQGKAWSLWLPLALLGCLLAGGCGSSASAGADTPGHKRQTGSGAASAHSPATTPAAGRDRAIAAAYAHPIHAIRLPSSWGKGSLRRGARVPARDVHPRAQLRPGTLVGLAMRGSLLGFAYPAVSTDAGATWRISGPLLYRAAADGAAAVNSVGVLPDGTVYLWGATGNFVRVSATGTSPWYETDLQQLTRVWPHGGTLLARTYPSHGVPPLFVSRDDGRTWSAR